MGGTHLSIDPVGDPGRAVTAKHGSIATAERCSSLLPANGQPADKQ